jgi:hypothetical protein
MPSARQGPAMSPGASIPLPTICFELRSWASIIRLYRAFAPNAAPHRACDYGEIRSPCTSSLSAAVSSHLALVQSEAPPSHQSRPVRLPLLPPTYQSPDPHARVNLLRLASHFFGGLREIVLRWRLTGRAYGHLNARRPLLLAGDKPYELLRIGGRACRARNCSIRWSRSKRLAVCPSA